MSSAPLIVAGPVADLLILAVVALITLPVLLSGHRISRLEGGAFVGAYLGYLAWLTLV